MKRAYAMTAFLLSLFLTFLFFTGCKSKNIDYLIQREKLSDAEELCMDSEGQEKTDNAAKLADYYFSKNSFPKAAQFYEIAGNHAQAVSCLLLADSPDQAETYCRRQSGPAQKPPARILANHFYQKGDFEKAMEWSRIAEDSQKIKWIQKQIPVFMQLETIKAILPATGDSGQQTILTQCRKNLRDYLTLETIRQWRHPRNMPTDEETARLFKELWNRLETTIIPACTDKLAGLPSASANWSKTDWDTLDFLSAKIKHLTIVLRSLDSLAENRNVFSQPGEPSSRESTLAADDNSPIPALYETLRANALVCAQGVRETLNIGDAETSPDLFPDIINDLKVDSDILAYLAELLNNIKTRFRDLEKHCSHMTKISATPETAQSTRRILDYFRAGCANVLENANKKEYEAANIQLLNTWDKAKKDAASLEKILQSG